MSSCPGPSPGPSLPYVRYVCFELMGVGKHQRIVWGARAEGTAGRPLLNKSMVAREELESGLSPLQEQSLHLFPNPFLALIFARSPFIGGV